MSKFYIQKSAIPYDRIDGLASAICVNEAEDILAPKDQMEIDGDFLKGIVTLWREKVEERNYGRYFDSIKNPLSRNWGYDNVSTARNILSTLLTRINFAFDRSLSSNPYLWANTLFGEIYEGAEVFPTNQQSQSLG